MWIISKKLASESCTSSQVLGVEYSAGSCSAIDAFVLSNGSHTHKPASSLDKTMDQSLHSRFGMTFKLLTGTSGADWLTSWLAASRAKTLAWQEKGPELTGNAAECGRTWPGSLAMYDHASHTLKTAQHSLIEDLTGCCVTLPRSGTMRSGQLWERQTLARRTSESASGFWPTPQASDNRDRGNMETPAIKRRIEKGKQVMLSMCVSSENGRLNPDWVEWLMGWPIGQTDLKPLETGRFQEWQQQHSHICTAG